MNRARILARFQSVIALAAICMTLSILPATRDTFLTTSNALNILREISVNVCLSIGMTMIILTGGIDLSVGSMLALAGAVAAGLLKNGVEVPPLNIALQFTPFGAVLAGLLVGTALGCFNGLVITRLRIHPFVATFAMMGIARGLTKLWTGGFPITGLGEAFGVLGAGARLGVPMQVWIAAGLVVCFVIVTKKTRLGRYIYAVGGNERAAHLSGVRVNRIKLAVYTMGGTLAGAAGLIVTSRLDSATPNAGWMTELDSIAAVVIGGTSLSGGRGSIMGTVLGCLIIGVLSNGLILLEVSDFWKQVVKGAVILVAVAIDKWHYRGD